MKKVYFSDKPMGKVKRKKCELVYIPLKPTNKKRIKGFEIGLQSAMVTTAIVATGAYLLARELKVI